MGILLEMGMVLGPKSREFIESVEECQARKLFELSHNFKVGDEVYLSAKWLADGRLPRAQYADIKGKVTEVVTRPEAGACIRTVFDGVGLNIWNPNEDLIRVDTATEALYGK